MALIRGSKGDFPCPVCLVPRDRQHVLNPNEVYELRTNNNMKEVYNTAQTLKSEDANALLQRHGLRNVEVSRI